MLMETVATAPHSAPPRNAFYFAAGIPFLALAKAKHVLKGYSTPKPFALSETERCIDYDMRVAGDLLGHLRAYGGSVEGMNVLELGPGSDLGVGLYLMSAGAASYTAFDRNELAADVPEAFYERFRERLGVPIDMSRVRYIARKDFDVAAALPPDSIDLVISNAAFEHFDDVATTVRQLAKVVRRGGKVITIIDLQTHSRWIRDKDPNNIYRYPRWFYRLFYAPGQPNRMRPADYRRAFEGAGWRNVVVKTSTRFDSRGRSVHKDFRDCEWLDSRSIVLCAIRA
jgi:SAM-dependent methyltransferase